MINNISGNNYSKMQFKANVKREEQNRFDALLNQNNVNVPGSAVLTDDQIKKLQAKYDVNDMSELEFEKLLDELYNLNVISKENKMDAFLEVIPKGEGISCTLTKIEQLTNYNDKIGYYTSLLKNEKSLVNHSNSTMKSHEKLLNILKSLMHR